MNPLKECAATEELPMGIGRGSKTGTMKDLKKKLNDYLRRKGLNQSYRRFNSNK